MRTHTIEDVNFLNFSDIMIMSEEYGQHTSYDLDSATRTGRIKEEHKWRPMFAPLENLINRIELTGEQWETVEKIFNLSLHYFILKTPTLKGTNPTPAQQFLNRISGKTASLKLIRNIFEKPNEEPTYEDLTYPIIYNYIPMMLYDLQTIGELREKKETIPELFHRFISKNITNAIDAILHKLFKWYLGEKFNLYEYDREILLKYCSQFREYLKSENFRGMNREEMLLELYEVEK
jgi:hypothetical protein